MIYINIFLLLGFSYFVTSDDQKLLTACEVHDVDCLTKTTQEFLEKTCKGIPAYDIKPIDPLFIPSLDLELSEEDGIWVHYKNITITGLKNQQFSDIKMDTTAKSVILKTKVDIDIASDVIMEFSKQKKSVSGPFKIKGTALGTAKYGYDLKTDDKGIEHYEVGPETITCEALGEPIVTIGPEFNQAVERDPDLKQQKEKNSAKAKQLKNQHFCEIVAAGYVTVVHNIRASAKIIPKTAFLKGI